jgi:4-hydroxybenzoate polyprenyltransferase
MLQTQMRDLGIPTTITITSLIFGAVTWLLVPAFLLAWGACSTYRYFLPKPKDYTWPYYALHGLMIGLSAAPIAYATGHWWWFLIRSLMLAVWMGGWSAAIGNADLEESGRYFPVGFSIYMIC